MDTKVMIVDDNQLIRESVKILFHSVGIEAVAADGGKECLRRLQEGFRGVILMDIMMPFMDGWDTIREIVAGGMYEGNIIVMLTGKGEPDQKMEGIQEYVTDYITKPFNPVQLIESVTYLAALREG